MSDNRIYKVIEVVGTSPDSVEDAIESAIDRADATVQNMKWFEVLENRGRIGDEGDVEQFQVKLKIGFALGE